MTDVQGDIFPSYPMGAITVIANTNVVNVFILTFTTRPLDRIGGVLGVLGAHLAGDLHANPGDRLLHPQLPDLPNLPVLPNEPLQFPLRPLAQLQGELLDSLWQTLEVGGILLYATCSVMPAENSDNIAAFLARTPGARELDIGGPFGVQTHHGRQLFPQVDGHDGFCYAKLIKVAAPPRD